MFFCENYVIIRPNFHFSAYETSLWWSAPPLGIHTG